MSNLIRAQQLLNAAAEITHDEATKKIIEAVTIITDELKAIDKKEEARAPHIPKIAQTAGR